MARKGRPWLINDEFAARQHERARNAAARLINADPQDVGLISSVGYGVAAAAKILPMPAGARVLVLQDDHSSAVLEWTTRIGGRGNMLYNMELDEGTGMRKITDQLPSTFLLALSVECFGGTFDAPRTQPAET